MSIGSYGKRELTLGRKILQINWFLVLLLIMIASVGFAM
ncbi:MAG: rod shape-determining protein RodA, partial [Oceanibaculum nanhaiense]|nr:rod shape-determining protein RodA [Oceanibaculum nanhaiense]